MLFLKAYEISKKDVYLDSAKRIEKYIMSVTRKDGGIDYCQGDAKGIGRYSNLYDIMPFAQGIALRFSKELHSLQS